MIRRQRPADASEQRAAIAAFGGREFFQRPALARRKDEPFRVHHHLE